MFSEDNRRTIMRLPSGPAIAADWWLVATTNDAVFFVGGESFDPANAASEAWLEIRPENVDRRAKGALTQFQ